MVLPWKKLRTGLFPSPVSRALFQQQGLVSHSIQFNTVIYTVAGRPYTQADLGVMLLDKILPFS